MIDDPDPVALHTGVVFRDHGRVDCVCEQPRRTFLGIDIEGFILVIRENEQNWEDEASRRPKRCGKFE